MRLLELLRAVAALGLGGAIGRAVELAAAGEEVATAVLAFRLDFDVATVGRADSAAQAARASFDNLGASLNRFRAAFDLFRKAMRIA